MAKLPSRAVVHLTCVGYSHPLHVPEQLWDGRVIPGVQGVSVYTQVEPQPAGFGVKRHLVLDESDVGESDCCLAVQFHVPGKSHKREQGARKRKCQKLSPNHCPLSNCFRGRDFILEQSRECCRLLFSAPELCSITGFISLFLTFLNVIVNLYHHFDMFFYEHHIFLISKRITPRIPFFLKKALVKSVFSADGDTEAAAPSQSLSLFD